MQVCYDPQRPGEEFDLAPARTAAGIPTSSRQTGDGRWQSECWWVRPVLGGEVLVLHLPRMVERVIGGVADEVWERPRPHGPLDLAGVVRAHRRDIVVSILPQALRRECPLLGIRSPTRFANSSLSLRITWRMIRSRSRPPPRGPLRISGETRAATPSKNVQQARNSVIARSSSASVIGPCSVEDGAKEMPQKSVEPGPILSSTISRGPAASKSRAMPARLATDR